MNIGNASDQTGLPAKTIRYYEEIGLVKPDRASNGYRDYSEKDLNRLAFLQRARSLGFSIPECRLLLSLYEDENRASADVKALALEKIARVEEKIVELKSLQSTLQSLADHCHGNSRPDCPIIEEIAGKSIQ